MSSRELQDYLSQKFQGQDSFMKTVLNPIFGSIPFEDAWGLEMLEDESLKSMASRNGVESVIKYGTFELPINPVEVFEITVSDRVVMRRNRVGIQQVVHRIIDTYSSAFIIFHYKDSSSWDWRFTFCQKDDKVVTENKRYTFLLGPGQSCRTAALNFHRLFEKSGNIEKKDLVEAFNVEALSKEFFDKYKAFYTRFVDFMLDETNGMRADFIDTEFDHNGKSTNDIKDREEKPIRNYVKRLLGRLVFLQFLQKKGWLGVPADKQWGDGDLNFLQNLFGNATQAQKDNFLDKVLEPLFFKALDKDRSADNDLFDTGVKEFRNVKIPYLNGGLFSRDKYDEPDSVFDAKLFEQLFEFFSEYNFTIDENDPNDAEVGIDPEMLGRIFENLLEDNKDKGAYYTPKEIVHYMCRESLIAYLQTDISDEPTREIIRSFVTTHDDNLLRKVSDSFADKIDLLLKNVKVCDPAIGSGAFPMGLLRELYLCRSAIEGYEQNVSSQIKKDIIQQNIYGVDIEKGAVDIARLRFWLTLILDEETPHALPNLDFKIMQGNSLLEQYRGIDLKDIVCSNSERNKQYKLVFDEESTAEALLKEHIHHYYRVENQKEKKQLSDRIEQAIRSLILAKASGNKEIEKSIRTLDFKNNSDFFLWHTYFKEVFDNGGFDIVIGNPPYISTLEAKKIIAAEIRNAYKETYKSACGTYDMYVIFIELGLKLLRRQGNLTVITPSKYLSAEYAAALRSYIIEGYSLDQVCDFSNVKVFESAGVSTVISQLSKRSQGNHVWFTTYKTLTDIDSKHLYKTNVLSILPNNLWGPLLSPNIKVFFKIFEKSVTVESHAKINACSTAAEADVYENHLVEKQLKKSFKYINNGTINQYVSFWGYKAIRKNKMITPYLPYSVLSERRIKMFQKKKLIFVKLAKRPQIYLDELGEYGSANTNMVYDVSGYDYKFLLAFFNSKLFNFVYRTMFGGLSMLGSVQIQAPQIRKSLIPNLEILNNTDISNIIDITSQIIKEKKLNVEANTSTHEAKIDRLIYNIYGLTKDEIKIVEETN